MTDREFLDLLIQDCIDDVSKLEGAAFNGRTVGEALGNILAMIGAVAKILQRSIPETEARHDRV